MAIFTKRYLRFFFGAGFFACVDFFAAVFFFAMADFFVDDFFDDFLAVVAVATFFGATFFALVADRVFAGADVVGAAALATSTDGGATSPVGGVTSAPGVCAILSTAGGVVGVAVVGAAVVGCVGVGGAAGSGLGAAMSACSCFATMFGGSSFAAKCIPTTPPRMAVAAVADATIHWRRLRVRRMTGSITGSAAAVFTTGDVSATSPSTNMLMSWDVSLGGAAEASLARITNESGDCSG